MVPGDGKRRKGRPKIRWEDDMKKVAGITWRRNAENKKTWRTLREAYAKGQADNVTDVEEWRTNEKVGHQRVGGMKRISDEESGRGSGRESKVFTPWPTSLSSQRNGPPELSLTERNEQRKLFLQINILGEFGISPVELAHFYTSAKRARRQRSCAHASALWERPRTVAAQAHPRALTAT
ncbi:hypothetical protein EVAR_37074_1 [Eumeta japonica]|uniref:Uncharacterized protein n=1 Tax=Eumeta variegata TaxID=151549 RepID=A0A4C1WHY9_EUMVA|nr:hypothetical protein EVAR_37074_1 [Eumeta japonica]